MTLKNFVLLMLICCVNTMTAETTVHNEVNGFMWTDIITPHPDGRRVYKHTVKDSNGNILFSCTGSVKFHCVDEKDKGQFVVRDKQRNGDFFYKDGIYDNNGYCIMPPKDGLFSIDTRFRYNDKYYYIARADDYKTGIINDKGQIVLPFNNKNLSCFIYNGIQPLNGCFGVEKKHSTSEGLIKIDGTIVIEPREDNFIHPYGRHLEARTPSGYSLLTYSGEFLVRDADIITDDSSKSRYIITMKDKSIGYLDYNGNWLLSPELGFSYIEELSGSTKNFYKVQQNGNSMYGIVSNSMREILPCEFEDIDYIGGDFFKFKSGDNWGVVSQNGKVIIPTSRGYTTIGKYSAIQGTIPFESETRKGECNKFGTVISTQKKAIPNQMRNENINQGISTLTTHAQSNYCEYTREFFSHPKSYSIEAHTLKMLGPSGVTQYSPGESSFNVTSNGFSYKFKDGSGSSRKITTPLKTVTVLTSHGDVQMQMYILDNGIAVRTIRYNDGHCVVHQYVLNNSTGKYINNDWFTLRK